MNTKLMAKAMGYVSLGIGATELLGATPLGWALGASEHKTLLRTFGLREIAAGVGLLSGKAPAQWMAARVAGDVVDLALLGTLLPQRGPRRKIVGFTIAAVALVSAADVWIALELAREGREAKAAKAEEGKAAPEEEKAETRVDDAVDERSPASDGPALTITGAEVVDGEVAASDGQGAAPEPVNATR